MYRSRCCLKGREPLLDGGTHWRHLANTMNLSVRRWRCFLSVATITVATCLVTYLDASRLCMDLNGLRVTTISAAKTDEPIKIPFARADSCEPIEPCIRRRCTTERSVRGGEAAIFQITLTAYFCYSLTYRCQWTVWAARPTRRLSHFSERQIMFHIADRPPARPNSVGPANSSGNTPPSRGAGWVGGTPFPLPFSVVSRAPGPSVIAPAVTRHPPEICLPRISAPIN